MISPQQEEAASQCQTLQIPTNTPAAAAPCIPRLLYTLLDLVKPPAGCSDLWWWSKTMQGTMKPWQEWIISRAGNEGPRSFHNQGGALWYPPNPYDLCICNLVYHRVFSPNVKVLVGAFKLWKATFWAGWLLRLLRRSSRYHGVSSVFVTLGDIQIMTDGL